MRHLTRGAAPTLILTLFILAVMAVSLRPIDVEVHLPEVTPDAAVAHLNNQISDPPADGGVDPWLSARQSGLILIGTCDPEADGGCPGLPTLPTGPTVVEPTTWESEENTAECAGWTYGQKKPQRWGLWRLRWPDGHKQPVPLPALQMLCRLTTTPTPTSQDWPAHSDEHLCRWESWGDEHITLSALWRFEWPVDSPQPLSDAVLNDLCELAAPKGGL